ncbi:MAG: ATP-binding protein [Desulfatirhabdiaceae bacterium]
MKRRLFWQIYPAFLVVILFSVATAGWYVSRSFEALYLQHVSSSLASQARMLEPQILEWLITPDNSRIQNLVLSIGQKTEARFTVILPSGQVVGDSHEDPASLDNHGDRPEIQSALQGNPSSSTRKSYTLSTRLMYVAQPVLHQGRLVGIIRTSIPVSAIDEAIKSLILKNGLGIIVIAVLGAVFSLAISRRISRPLEDIRRAAQQFARGELDVKLPVPESDELAGVTEALNRMAVELNERIQVMSTQRYEQETILAGMIEGVLALDNQERLMTVNHAASRLLGIRQFSSPMPTIHEVVRNIHLLQVVVRVRKTGQAVEQEIILHVPEARTIHVRGNLLIDSQGNGIGVLIVLHDITRLRQLETVRRDFVANVSHELRTPITAIKGFVETLLNGAVNEPEHAGHFLSIIARQVDRLNEIIEDLLCLSRIERDAEHGAIPLSGGPVQDVLKSAIQNCKDKALSRNMTLELVCPSDLQAMMNDRLLEEAVINLLDNAIQYSRPGTTIRIEAVRNNHMIDIHVHDEGPGIASEHLPRLFERFYRVDSGRSRRDGGTGLGLSIVRHIMNAHAGRVTVVSEPGQGSVFSLHLPCP